MIGSVFLSHSSVEPGLTLATLNVMEVRSELIAKYKLFNSPLRGESAVEAELSALMKGMTTPENVKKLEPVVEGPLGINADKLKSLKDAFKRIDEERKSGR